LHHTIASLSIASHHTSYRINRKKIEHEANLWKYFVE
jgi:hypothetical protein